MLPMGSFLDGNVKFISWICETFHLKCQVSENVLTDINLNLTELESSLKSLQEPEVSPDCSLQPHCVARLTPGGVVASGRYGGLLAVFGTDAIIDQQINGLAGGGGLGPLSGITSAQRGRQGSGQTALTSS